LSIVAIIPAYNPPKLLVGFVQELRCRVQWPIIVVDDGSSIDRYDIFEQLRAVDGVIVLRHAANVGKGAALKTGFNHALVTYGPEATLLTVDADGQHLIDDVIKVAETALSRGGELILGVRRIEFLGTPFRSFLGNTFTRGLLRLLVGLRLRDTQTGLRAIPGFFAKRLLLLSTNGYDFELEMLIMAQHTRLSIAEQPISTFYDKGNTTSHFDPIFDSARIYRVLFRFLIAALLSSVADNMLFGYFLSAGFGIGAAQAVARCIAIPLNFFLLQRFVFYSHQDISEVLPRYVVVVLAFFGMSSALVAAVSQTSIGPLLGKMLIECALFPLNFLVQRDFVFASRGSATPATKTDWDSYYERPFPASSWTRRYTARRLVDTMRRFLPQTPVQIMELGGANSCFFHDVRRAVEVQTYHIIDSNRTGLAKSSALDDTGVIQLNEADVLIWQPVQQFDLVYSIGLIEHFSPLETAAVIRQHFKAARAGGLVIMTVPTPTWLYQMIRGVAEMFKMWQFPDERPILFEEVHRTASEHGALLHEETLWPLGLTQILVAYRVKGGVQDAQGP
jgi:glycosyltransferase involved in cell wall biosynthesis